MTVHLGFDTEGASVFGVRADFNFLHHFSEGGAITGPVFPNNSDLLGAFSQVRTKMAGFGKVYIHMRRITLKPPEQLELQIYDFQRFERRVWIQGFGPKLLDRKTGTWVLVPGAFSSPSVITRGTLHSQAPLL